MGWIGKESLNKGICSMSLLSVGLYLCFNSFNSLSNPRVHGINPTLQIRNYPRSSYSKYWDWYLCLWPYWDGGACQGNGRAGAGILTLLCFHASSPFYFRSRTDFKMDYFSQINGWMWTIQFNIWDSRKLGDPGSEKDLTIFWTRSLDL